MASKTVLVLVLGILLGVSGLLVYKVMDVDSKMKGISYSGAAVTETTESSKWTSQKIGELVKENEVMKVEIKKLQADSDVQSKTIADLKSKVEQQDDSVIKILKKAMSSEIQEVKKKVVEKSIAPIVKAEKKEIVKEVPTVVAKEKEPIVPEGKEEKL